MVAGGIWKDMNRNVPKQEGLFKVSGNNWGLACPFEPIVCRRGYCDFCETYHEWQKLGEIVVICAWCSKVKDKKPNIFGRPVVSHGMCPDCKEKYFLDLRVGTQDPDGN